MHIRWKTPTPLAADLRAQDRTQVHVAKLAGIDEGNFSRIVRGISRPTPMQIWTIRAATGGRVGFDDWFDVADQRAR